MTAEIRTGAKRSEQKGSTAASRKFKAGRNYRDKWPGKEEGPRTGVPCYIYRSHNQKSICHSEGPLKGGTEYTPTINIKFYACCTLQKPEEDIDSSKCRVS